MSTEQHIEAIDVDQKTKDTVSGFIRKIKNLFPSDIARLCLLYYFVEEQFDPDNCPKYQLSNNNKTVAKCGSGSRNAYLTKIVNTGVHRWRFKLEYEDLNLPLSIGIFKTKTKGGLKQGYNNTAENFSKKNGYAVVVSYQRRARNKGIGKAYGKRQSKSGDIYEMILDFNKRTLSFNVNDEFWGIAFDKIEQTSYRAVVCAGYWWDKFHLLSYQSSS